MRLYLEPSVLVKLFKREQDSAKMIEVVDAIDSRAHWFACTSAWSSLEVARALRKDGKPKELIELNLRELRRHKIVFVEVTRGILTKSENIIASRSIYASDALHAATFESVAKRRSLEGMLSDDAHFERLKGIVEVLTLHEISITNLVKTLEDPPAKRQGRISVDTDRRLRERIDLETKKSH